MKTCLRLARCLAVLSAVIGLHSLRADEFADAPASTNTLDPELAIKQFHVAPGLKVELFASEPSLANPVAFSIDEKGRFFVAETYRHSAVGTAFRKYEGVLDIRSHMEWLDDDLAARSVQDRIDFLKRRLGTEVQKLAVESEKIRLIEDRDGDGKADFSSVFADGFNHIPDGIGAGVLAREGKVWYTCIPDLWLLQDTNQDGRADLKQSLHTGYGVHVSYLGHDLHGLAMGFDGRLYFSIGDRGLNVTNREGQVLCYPDEGAVLRCEPDGTGLEVFAHGLRNPQKLVFDQYGNLFTGDNNSDGGDRARWVHVVEGGDSGWRMGYQHMNTPPRRGPWNAERLWYPQWEGQAAYIVPPIANLGYGPSGCAYFPGTGLPSRYQDHFFLCDFRGGASSGIHTFTLKPKGASYELASYEQFIWETLPTDVDFGVNGGLYFSDWVQGWNKTGKGRIYRVYDPNLNQSADILETKRLLSEGMGSRTVNSLTGLLAHADMRVRRDAQFELARRAVTQQEDWNALVLVAQGQAKLLSRLHALWGLGQAARKSGKSLAMLAPLLKDRDSEVRGQTAKILGEARATTAAPELTALLRDPEARVRFAAAIALGRLRFVPSIPDLFKMLEENADKDPVLRHAGVHALAAIGNTEALLQVAKSSSSSVRMGSLLALRSLKDSRIALFLRDAEPALVLEAARAINDVPIDGAMPELARLLERSRDLLGHAATKTQGTVVEQNKVQKVISSVVPETGTTSPAEQLFQRSINANFRMGADGNAQALASFAIADYAPASLRAEAIEALADWERPSGRDRIMGLWRPLPPREAEVAVKALQPLIGQLLKQGADPVRLAALDAVRKLPLKGVEEDLVQIAIDQSGVGAVRAEALKTLDTAKSSRLDQAVQGALNAQDNVVRNVAWKIQAESKPTETVALLTEKLRGGVVPEQQSAFAILGGIPDSSVDHVIAEWMGKLLDGKLKQEIELDLLDAAGKRNSVEVLAKVKQFEEARPRNPLGAFRESYYGGNAEEGRKIFYERAEVFCSRCHKINGDGGEAGPDLTGIGGRKDRGYIVESILFPNRQIAQGWENVLVTLQDGTSYAGKLRQEDAAFLVVDSPEDGEVKIDKTKIKTRERALSAMPEEFRHVLTKQDVRNLVEFLATTVKER